MYLDIPKSCEFGGCRLYNECPNKEYKVREHKGRSYSPPPNREEYEFTCESCGADMSLEDSVYEFGKGYCCERCLKEEFKVGDVEAIIDKECGG